MSTNVKLVDPISKTEYELEQDFVDKVLDFKKQLGDKKPTRKQLADLMEKAPKNITDEIQVMFKRYYYHESL